MSCDLDGIMTYKIGFHDKGQTVEDLTRSDVTEPCISPLSGHFCAFGAGSLAWPVNRFSCARVTQKELFPLARYALRAASPLTAAAVELRSTAWFFGVGPKQLAEGFAHVARAHACMSAGEGERSEPSPADRGDGGAKRSLIASELPPNGHQPQKATTLESLSIIRY